MIITYEKDGSVKWEFFRKAYRKARWRKAGQRALNDALKRRTGTHGMIIYL